MGVHVRATKRRFKDGKEHGYWSVVENRRRRDGRVVQRQVLYLGEINDSQRAAWCRSIEVLRGASGPTQMALFPADREAPDLACEVVRVSRGRATASAAAVGRVLAGAERLGVRGDPRAGAGPVLGAAIAVESARDALAGRAEGAGVLPADRAGQRLAAAPALVRAQRLARSVGKSGDLSSDTLYRCLDKLEAHRRAFFSFLRERWETLFEARFASCFTI